MTILQIILGVLLLPFFLFVACAVGYIIFMSWLFLLAVCKVKWAQEKFRSMLW